MNQVQHDGIPDEEPRTWTRSVGTKNRSCRKTGSRSEILKGLE